MHPFRKPAALRRTVVAAAFLAAFAAGPRGAFAADGAASATANAAAAGNALTPAACRVEEPLTVSIYEFRSSLGDLSARSATDMLKTALVRVGRFCVVERSRLNEGVLREKQLNGQGLSSGTAAQQKLRDARYLLEGAVTEANASTTQHSAAVSIGGLQLGGGTNQDEIVIDLRVVEVATGDVVATSTVHKTLSAENVSVGGLGTLIGNVLAQRGRAVAYVPDAQATSGRRDGVDSTLRAALEQAVAELASRF
jgi:curli biogenesis system outer membrane secretion channel CsgG